MRPPTLAIDFDGVLCDPMNVLPGYRMGQPCAGAVEAMTALRRRGFQLVVFTCNRIGPVSDWLKHFNVPHDLVTNTKPDADVYIDDRALRHVDWPSTLATLAAWRHA